MAWQGVEQRGLLTPYLTPPHTHTTVNTAPDQSWLNPNWTDPNSNQQTPTLGPQKELPAALQYKLCENMNFGTEYIIQECFLAVKFAKSKPIAEPDHTLESSDARSLL